MRRKTGLASQFPLESHLAQVVELQLAELVCAKNQEVVAKIPQLAIGMKVPDFVIVLRRGEPLMGRMRKLSFFESAVYCEILRTKSRRAGDVAVQLRCRVSAVEKAVSRLARAGLIVERRNQSLRALRGNEFLRYEVISVEAKLSRWKQAIEQAQSYFAFSDQTFVALPAGLAATNEQVRKQCRAAGVGLIAVEADRTMIRFSCRSTRRSTPERIWLLSSILSRKDSKV